MGMRRKIVAGNWKMNGDRAFAKRYLDEFLPQLSTQPGSIDIVIAPPAVLLSEMQQAVTSNSNVLLSLAGQNVSTFDSGAYTGELSAAMLLDSGCKWCLVGHSERRSLFDESDLQVIDKVAHLFNVGIQPILCVGESLVQRESGEAESIVAAQIDAVFNAFDEQVLSSLVVAYEPVWAIGTGQTASPQQAQDMHQFIRERVALKSALLASELSILYGGSVNAANAKELFGQKDIDGGLVGGASLKIEEFKQICECMG